MTAEYIKDTEERVKNRKNKYRELQRDLVGTELSMADVIREAEPELGNISGLYHMLKHGKLSDSRLQNILTTAKKMLKNQ